MKTDISAGSKHDRNFAVLMSLSQIQYPAQKVWNHSYNIFQHSDLMPRSDNWELAITSAIPPHHIWTALNFSDDRVQTLPVRLQLRFDINTETFQTWVNHQLDMNVFCTCRRRERNGKESEGGREGGREE